MVIGIYLELEVWILVLIRLVSKLNSLGLFLIELGIREEVFA